VVGLLTASSASAADESALQARVNELTEQVAALSAQQNSLLSQEVAQYLERNEAWRGAEGGEKTAWDKITLRSRITIVTQATVGLDPANRTVVGGDVDLDFDFAVSENLDVFVYLTANTDSEEAFDEAFSGLGGSTASGLLDGIGVNGTVSTDPGSITVREAGIRHRVMAGDTRWNIDLGELEPRNMYGDTDMTADENRAFLNNIFDDSSAVPWASIAGGSTVLGMNVWADFGTDKNIRFSIGWFNFPGQFFNNGQLFLQVGWKGEVNGRAMNLKVFGFIDSVLEEAFGFDDAAAGGGLVWDWWVTAKVGVFVKITANGSDANPTEFDAALGAVINGLFGSRPDDQLGIGLAFIALRDGTTFSGGGAFPEDMEITLEVYYRASLEGGKMHATFGFQVISDQGGGIGWADDTLFILQVRLFVPF
jgi:hypothetical protein